jgi:hypothetical protein
VCEIRHHGFQLAVGFERKGVQVIRIVQPNRGDPVSVFEDKALVSHSPLLSSHFAEEQISLILQLRFHTITAPPSILIACPVMPLA